MDLPYHTHPLYNLRKALVIIAGIGIILCVASTPPYIPAAITIAPAVTLFASLLLSTFDLFSYVVWKAQHPDQEPKWPTTVSMVGDVVLAAMQQIVFWIIISNLRWNYWTPYGRVKSILRAYGCLAVLLCS